ncbi:hypothetical protein [Hydrogenivirga sp. 128-5-R1-1]|uniref:hypothetical protein n=1 Tax=Hydrogenivirga sp. 128-5-R1-1 TaxID=392423 RepID=UPI00015F0BE4|nr:hypothetical protein [Hydrogenivirga sp. 128-5-R1-1]EDP75901.1 hypothetical protein HG1285_06230 [Hydrogenivirga sp. 128-5-R1-1]
MRLFVAAVLLLLGVVGLVLPLIPGVPFLIAFLYLAGLLDRDRFLRSIKKFQGRRNTFQRRLVSCILINLVYRRRFNLK